MQSNPTANTITTETAAQLFASFAPPHAPVRAPLPRPPNASPPASKRLRGLAPGNAHACATDDIDVTVAPSSSLAAVAQAIVALTLRPTAAAAGAEVLVLNCDLRFRPSRLAAELLTACPRAASVDEHAAKAISVCAPTTLAQVSAVCYLAALRWRTRLDSLHLQPAPALDGILPKPEFIIVMSASQFTNSRGTNEALSIAAESLRAAGRGPVSSSIPVSKSNKPGNLVKVSLHLLS
ncbi:hypothetical protein HDU84_009298 [Entophlyctis sp. JEL0112]|nr:hypothetical protein HDU84_009298 [Entophlyctis sp. JEL0112]